MRHSKLIIPVVGLLLVAGAVLAACGDINETTTEPTATVTTTATTTVAPAVTESPVASPVASERVKLLQAELEEAGYYSGPINGLYDDATHAAIIKVQTDGGIAVDGIYGPETHAVLIRVMAGEDPQAATATASPTTMPAASKHIKQVQQELKQLGYYKGAIDGIYGPRTTAAVVAFQKDWGLAADGKLGPKTDEALAKAMQDYAN
jgi:peptidoglycan hydrolase-like protein with peptidoglycan-binding domain